MRFRCGAVTAAMLLATACGEAPPDAGDPRALAGSWMPSWASLEQAQVRPGARLGESAHHCTAGFLYVDPVQRLYYLGTAAHCTDSADGSTTDGTGRRIDLDGHGEIGTVIYDSDGVLPNTPLQQNAPQIDLSLILLDPGVNLLAHPQVISFAGPTGFTGCADVQPGALVGLYGQGSAFNSIGTLHSRTGALVRCDTGIRDAMVAIPVDFGDSGGPLLHLATGHALAHTSGGAAAMLVGPAMDLVMQELAAAGFGDLALATVDGGYASRPTTEASR